MAFMDRGNFPSMGNGDMGDFGDNNFNRHEHGYHRGPYLYRRFYYYIPLDNTYVIMQMIVTFIILIVGAITFIATYKSTIIDPIESTKKIFISTHLTIMVIFLVLTFIINFHSKDELTLIKRLTLFSIISIITMLIFCGIKLNLDATYTKDKFEQLYSKQNIEDKSSKKDISESKINVGITGVSIKTEKEYYIDECIKLYGIFKTKTYGTLGLHLLLNILLIYQISRVSKLQRKKERLNKDDAILFDEEQNVKF